MGQINDDVDEQRLKLNVLKEVNRVIRGHYLKKEQPLTVGDVIGFIEIAIKNVITQERRNKPTEKVHD